MALATLSIDIVARLASLEQSLTRATQVTEQHAERMSTAYSGVQSAVRAIGAALGTYLSVRAFENLVSSAIDAQDHLNDLAKRAQVTVEQIGGIGFAAKQAGGDVDSAAFALGRLNVSIAKANAGDARTAELYTRVGISLRDNVTGASKDAGQVLVELANKFASYEDGPEKAALGNAIFGKSYQGLLPLLEGGGAELQKQIDYYNRYSGVTSASAAAADAFNDSLTQLHLLQGAFGTQLANALLPTLQALVDRFTESKEKGDGFRVAAEGIAGALRGLVDIGAFVVESLAAMSDRLTGIIRKAEALNDLAADARKNSGPLDIFGSGSFDFGRAGAIFKAIDQDTAAGVASAQKRYDDFVASLNRAPATADYSNEGRGHALGRTTAPDVPNRAARATHQRTTEIERLIQRLNEQTIAELTVGDTFRERAEFELAANPKLINATEAQRKAYLDLADGLDKLRAKYDQMNTVAQSFRLSEIRGTDSTNNALRNQQLQQMEDMSRLFRGTPDQDVQRQVQQEVQLRQYLDEIGASADDATAAINSLYHTNPDPTLRALTEMQQQVESFSTTIDQTLGQGLTDLLEGNFANIGKSFERMLEQMAVKALQTDIMDKLFGAAGAGGSRAGGGLIDAAISWIGGLGGRASGGSVSPYSLNRVNEHGPELLEVQGKEYLMAGSQWGKVTPRGGGASAPTVVFQIAAGVSRNELAALVPQLRATIKGDILTSMRRPGFSGA